MVMLLVCIYHTHLNFWSNCPRLGWEVQFWKLPVSHENTKYCHILFTRLHTMRCNVSLVINTSWPVHSYVGGVPVHCWWNLGHKPGILLGEAILCHKYNRTRLHDVSTTDANGWRDISVYVRAIIMACMIACDGWPESCPEHNTSTPHSRHTIAPCTVWRSSLPTWYRSQMWLASHLNDR